MIILVTVTVIRNSECLFALLADAILTNSTHQGLIRIVNTEKRCLLNVSFSGVDQGCPNLVHEGQRPAEFSYNPN